MDLGPHAVFIWLAYAAAAIVLAGLAIWLLASGARLKRALATLESRGEGRRTRRGEQGRDR